MINFLFSLFFSLLNVQDPLNTPLSSSTTSERSGRSIWWAEWSGERAFKNPGKRRGNGAV